MRHYSIKRTFNMNGVETVLPTPPGKYEHSRDVFVYVFTVFNMGVWHAYNEYTPSGHPSHNKLQGKGSDERESVNSLILNALRVIYLLPEVSFANVWLAILTLFFAKFSSVIRIYSWPLILCPAPFWTCLLLQLISQFWPSLFPTKDGNLCYSCLSRAFGSTLIASWHDITQYMFFTMRVQWGDGYCYSWHAKVGRSHLLVKVNICQRFARLQELTLVWAAAAFGRQRVKYALRYPVR